MIGLGEKIVVETFNITDEQLEMINDMPNVIDVELRENVLTVRQKNGASNLVNLMSFIADQGISYGKIYSELPTLNDVFLEITGKELRD
jgi:ABC-2 type transport system ATP-binding protein